MFKPKKEDKLKEKFKKDLEKHSDLVQREYLERQKQSKKLLDKNYVAEQLAIGKQKEEEMEKVQQKVINKTMSQIKKTELNAFRCKDCNTWVDLQNLTCPKCGKLYCQWCGSAMDMMNPGLCPRCQRPPMYTPAELVITKVEDLPPEDRFWEDLPTCPKCGATVQPDWPQCPICNAKLTPTAAAPSGDGSDTGEYVPDEGEPAANEEVPAEAEGDKKKKDKKRKSGI